MGRQSQLTLVEMPSVEENLAALRWPSTRSLTDVPPMAMMGHIAPAIPHFNSSNFKRWYEATPALKNFIITWLTLDKKSDLFRYGARIIALFNKNLKSSISTKEQAKIKYFYDLFLKEKELYDIEQQLKASGGELLPKGSSRMIVQFKQSFGLPEQLSSLIYEDTDQRLLYIETAIEESKKELKLIQLERGPLKDLYEAEKTSKNKINAINEKVVMRFFDTYAVRGFLREQVNLPMESRALAKIEKYKELLSAVEVLSSNIIEFLKLAPNAVEILRNLNSALAKPNPNPGQTDIDILQAGIVSMNQANDFVARLIKTQASIDRLQLIINKMRPGEKQKLFQEQLDAKMRIMAGLKLSDPTDVQERTHKEIEEGLKLLEVRGETVIKLYELVSLQAKPTSVEEPEEATGAAEFAKLKKDLQDAQDTLVAKKIQAAATASELTQLTAELDDLHIKGMIATSSKSELDQIRADISKRQEEVDSRTREAAADEDEIRQLEIKLDRVKAAWSIKIIQYCLEVGEPLPPTEEMVAIHDEISQLVGNFERAKKALDDGVAAAATEGKLNELRINLQNAEDVLAIPRFISHLRDVLNNPSYAYLYEKANDQIAHIIKVVEHEKLNREKEELASQIDGVLEELVAIEGSYREESENNPANKGLPAQETVALAVASLERLKELSKRVEEAKRKVADVLSQHRDDLNNIIGEEKANKLKEAESSIVTLEESIKVLSVEIEKIQDRIKTLEEREKKVPEQAIAYAKLAYAVGAVEQALKQRGVSAKRFEEQYEQLMRNAIVKVSKSEDNNVWTIFNVLFQKENLKGLRFDANNEAVLAVEIHGRIFKVTFKKITANVFDVVQLHQYQADPSNPLKIIPGAPLLKEPVRVSKKGNLLIASDREAKATVVKDQYVDRSHQIEAMLRSVGIQVTPAGIQQQESRPGSPQLIVASTGAGKSGILSTIAMVHSGGVFATQSGALVDGLVKDINDFVKSENGSPVAKKLEDLDHPGQPMSAEYVANFLEKNPYTVMSHEQLILYADVLKGKQVFMDEVHSIVPMSYERDSAEKMEALHKIIANNAVIGATATPTAEVTKLLGGYENDLSLYVVQNRLRTIRQIVKKNTDIRAPKGREAEAAVIQALTWCDFLRADVKGYTNATAKQGRNFRFGSQSQGFLFALNDVATARKMHELLSSLEDSSEEGVRLATHLDEVAAQNRAELSVELQREYQQARQNPAVSDADLVKIEARQKQIAETLRQRASVSVCNTLKERQRKIIEYNVKIDIVVNLKVTDNSEKDLQMLLRNGKFEDLDEIYTMALQRYEDQKFNKERRVNAAAEKFRSFCSPTNYASTIRGLLNQKNFSVLFNYHTEFKQLYDQYKQEVLAKYPGEDDDSKRARNKELWAFRRAVNEGRFSDLREQCRPYRRADDLFKGLFCYPGSSRRFDQRKFIALIEDQGLKDKAKPLNFTYLQMNPGYKDLYDTYMRAVEKNHKNDEEEKKAEAIRSARLTFQKLMKEEKFDELEPIFNDEIRRSYIVSWDYALEKEKTPDLAGYYSAVSEYFNAGEGRRPQLPIMQRLQSTSHISTLLDQDSPEGDTAAKRAKALLGKGLTMFVSSVGPLSTGYSNPNMLSAIMVQTESIRKSPPKKNPIIQRVQASGRATRESDARARVMSITSSDIPEEGCNLRVEEIFSPEGTQAYVNAMQQYTEYWSPIMEMTKDISLGLEDLQELIKVMLVDNVQKKQALKFVDDFDSEVKIKIRDFNENVQEFYKKAVEKTCSAAELKSLIECMAREMASLQHDVEGLLNKINPIVQSRGNLRGDLGPELSQKIRNDWIKIWEKVFGEARKLQTQQKEKLEVLKQKEQELQILRLIETSKEAIKPIYEEIDGLNREIIAINANAEAQVEDLNVLIERGKELLVRSKQLLEQQQITLDLVSVTPSLAQTVQEDLTQTQALVLKLQNNHLVHLDADLKALAILAKKAHSSFDQV